VVVFYLFANTISADLIFRSIKYKGLTNVFLGIPSCSNAGNPVLSDLTSEEEKYRLSGIG
jgi:hypothetical protein